MESGLKILAYALSAKGSEANLDNVYVNGHYFSTYSEDPAAYNKANSVDFQMYGVCDGANLAGVPLKTSPASIVMQRMQHLQSILSMDGAISRDKIWNFLCETNSRMRDLQASAGSEEISSTFAGIFLHKNRGLAVHLGDSRIYVIRGGRMLQITEDHLESSDLYKLGVITQQQAEIHKLSSRPTATLGMKDIYDAESSVFSKYFVFYPGDIFILCTDGITDSVSNAGIEQLVRECADPSEIAAALMNAAQDQNDDNKSVLVLYVDAVDGEGGAVKAAAAPAPAKKAAPRQDEAEDADEEPEETAKPVEKAAKKAGFAAALSALATKVGGSQVDFDFSKKDKTEKAADETADEAASEAAEAADDEVDENEEAQDEQKKSRSKLSDKFAGMFAGFGRKAKDQDEDEDEEDEENEADENDQEDSGDDAASAAAAAAYAASQDEASEDEVADQEDAEDEASDYEDSEDETEDEDEVSTDTITYRAGKAGLAGAAAAGSDEDEDAQEADENADEEDEEEDKDEDESILDKIFGNPKLIFAILGGIVLLILAIVLLTSLLGGSKKPSKDQSSAVEVSSIVETDSKDDSLTDSSITEPVAESSDESVAESKEESGAHKSDASGKLDYDAPDESSKEESSEEESSEEESSEEESSEESSEEEYTYEESSEEEYTEESYEESADVKSITISEGDTYWGIITEYYGEWNEDLVAAWCRYNGIEYSGIDSLPGLYGGDVLLIPTKSELGL